MSSKNNEKSEATTRNNLKPKNARSSSSELEKAAASLKRLMKEANRIDGSADIFTYDVAFAKILAVVNRYFASKNRSDNPQRLKFKLVESREPESYENREQNDSRRRRSMKNSCELWKTSKHKKEGSKESKNKKEKAFYTEEEDDRMVQWIRDNPDLNPESRITWRMMREEFKIKNRSPNSLCNRYRHYLCKNPVRGIKIKPINSNEPVIGIIND